jgi:hypothetical protein
MRHGIDGNLFCLLLHLTALNRRILIVITAAFPVVWATFTELGRSIEPFALMGLNIGAKIRWIAWLSMQSAALHSPFDHTLMAIVSNICTGVLQFPSPCGLVETLYSRIEMACIVMANGIVGSLMVFYFEIRGSTIFDIPFV